MENTFSGSQFFGQEKISKILLKIAPPVMLAQLIQALYNIVDSLFVGRYSDYGLTALSIIYPIQLLMIALAVGTGVGINTAMAARYGVGKKADADEFAGVGTPWRYCCGFYLRGYAGLSCPLLQECPLLPRLLSKMSSYMGVLYVYSALVCSWRASGRRFSRPRAI